MFTVCPKCTLTLVVTPVDLRAGQGYVRCGRCANVFNALIALREGDPNGGTSDTANRRLQETAPTPPINPAVGAGVAMDFEPEPEAELEPELPPEPEPELLPSGVGAEPNRKSAAPPDTWSRKAVGIHRRIHDVSEISSGQAADSRDRAAMKPW